MSQYDIFWIWWGTENGNDYFCHKKQLKMAIFDPFHQLSKKKNTTLGSCNLYKIYIFRKLEAMGIYNIQVLSVLLLSCDLHNFSLKWTLFTRFFFYKQLHFWVQARVA